MQNITDILKGLTQALQLQRLLCSYCGYVTEIKQSNIRQNNVA
jgi:hypothetical protein